MSATQTVRYRQIADSLRKGIYSGKYREGSMLPSEQEVCKMFNTSRITARSALRSIVAEGLAESLPKIGRRVLAQRENETNKRLGEVVVYTAPHNSSSSFFTPFREVLSQHKLGARFEPVRAWKEEEFIHVLHQTAADSEAVARVVIDNMPPTEKIRNILEDTGQPFLYITAVGAENLNTISWEDDKSAAYLVNHLYELGHRNISFFENESFSYNHAFRKRKQGYSDTMERLGLIPRFLGLEQGQNLQMDDIEDRLRSMLNLDDPEHRATAIIVNPADHAGMIGSILLRMNIRIPADVSFCGFLDIQDADLKRALGISQLTNVSEPWEDFGRVAALRIQQMLAGFVEPIQQIYLNLVFNEGDSVVSI